MHSLCPKTIWRNIHLFDGPSIHVDITSALSIDSYSCTVRFIARRGPVKLIKLDRESNLVGAHDELSPAIHA